MFRLKGIQHSNYEKLDREYHFQLIEQYNPYIAFNGGYDTKKNITLHGAANLDASDSTGVFKTPSGVFTLTNGGTVPTGKTLAITDTAALTLGGVIVANYEYVTSPTFAAATFANGSAFPIYTFPNDGTTWKMVFASLRFTTAASSAATAQIFLDPSGTAPGAGTAQFATMALNGSANTVVNATTPVNTASAAGACISLAAAGAATTGLVGLVVTIALQRLT